jgi:hypothetical protein
MTTEYASIAIAILSLLWVIFLEYRLRKLFRGHAVSSLEDILRGLAAEVEAVQDQNVAHGEALSTLDARLKKAVKTVTTVRFNPFREMGSNQSFAAAFLNDDGDGVVISTLMSRDRTHVFAKPVKQFVSEHDITPEERQALEEAAR